MKSKPILSFPMAFCQENRDEVSEKQDSSLLNNIFSTILNLASLQKDVWSVFGKDLPQERPSVLCTRNPVFDFFRALAFLS